MGRNSCSDTYFDKDLNASLILPAPVRKPKGYLVKPTFQHFKTPHRKYHSTNK